jgi:hypothetical protein
LTPVKLRAIFSCGAKRVGFFMKRLLAPLAALVIGALPLPAIASAVSVNTVYGFGFGGVGSSLVSSSGFGLPTNPAGIDSPDTPWTFTFATAGTFYVLDLFNSGDQFEIFDNLTSIGTTSAPTQGSDCGSDVTCALGNSDFSLGSFALAAGSHSITGTAILSPFGGGAGAFLAETSAVPLPGTLILLTSALGVLGGAGVRARAKRRA